MERFQKGDIVGLKSNGPKMTVKQVNEDSTITCVWFDGLTLKEAPFDAATLKKVVNQPLQTHARGRGTNA